MCRVKAEDVRARIHKAKETDYFEKLGQKNGGMATD